jgi:hypothetical protein
MLNKLKKNEISFSEGSEDDKDIVLVPGCDAV